MTRIDRWNRGELRRYHLDGGAVLVCSSKPRRAAIIPAWCAHITAPVDRIEAAAILRAARTNPARRA